jgi:glutamyl-Q tRNA(Asp) synthetase
VSYVGRFAPSPTGPLHLGSLSTAVASFLHARQNGGRWLVRIEDLDPPRTVPGAADGILSTLDAMALHWDGDVLYQSARSAEYRSIAEQLLERGLAFRCDCSRRMLRGHIEDPELGPRYPGTCRRRGLSALDTAIRVRVDAAPVTFEDAVQGEITVDLERLLGDYLIYRRDAVPAYHLAVVVDDDAQSVTTIVRGSDLLRSSAVHLHLGSLLGFQPARYVHVPVLTHASGEKMSKQRGAARVDIRNPGALGAQILEWLGSPPPAELAGAPPDELWEWGAEHWRCDRLHGQLAVTAER